jgi:hypothetical protein
MLWHVIHVQGPPPPPRDRAEGVGLYFSVFSSGRDGEHVAAMALGLVLPIVSVGMQSGTVCLLGVLAAANTGESP